MEFDAHVLSPAVQVPDGSEVSTDVTSGTLVVPIEVADDFHEGTHVRIDGEVYTYDDSLLDGGEESGQATITLDSGLVDDVAAGTLVESWNPNANGGVGEVISDWLVSVVPDGETDGHDALILHTLIPTLPSTMPLMVGDSVRVRADDDGSWTVTNVNGARPGYDPGFIRTGGLGADTVVWAGTENGRRAQLDGIDGALECYNDANEQTVNLDGANNYVEGTFATAPSGPRVEVGALSGHPEVNEVRIYSGDADETAPGRVYSSSAGGFATISIVAPDTSSETLVAPVINLQTTPTGNVISAESAHRISLIAEDTISLSAASEVAVEGCTLNATMGDGSVGTGTFAASGVAYAADQETANRVTTGVETFSRETAATTTAMTSGTLRLTYFTAYADMTVASLKTATGATAAATPTTCKMGLYSIDGSGNLTRIGITANDTALWNATTTAFTKALTSPVAITKGTRYVFAALYVGTTAPVLVARTVSQAIGNSNNRLMGAVSGQTDIPSSITAGTVSVAGVQVYGELVP